MGIITQSVIIPFFPTLRICTAITITLEQHEQQTVWASMIAAFAMPGRGEQAALDEGADS